jgi:hypothetical protein
MTALDRDQLLRLERALSNRCFVLPAIYVFQTRPVADKNENNHFIFGRLWIVLKQ